MLFGFFFVRDRAELYTRSVTQRDGGPRACIDFVVPNKTTSLGFVGERRGNGMNKLFRLWESEEYAVCSLSPRNPQRDPAKRADWGRLLDFFRGPQQNPAQRFCWGKEGQRNERAFPLGKSEGYAVCPDVFHVKHTLRLFCGGGRIGVRRVHCVLDGGLGVLQLLLQGFVFLFHLLQFLFQFFQFLL